MAPIQYCQGMQLSMDGTEVAPSVVCWFQQCSEGIEQHVHLPTRCEAQMTSIDARSLLRSNCPSSFEFLSQLSDTLDGDGESEDEVRFVFCDGQCSWTGHARADVPPLEDEFPICAD